MVRSTTHFFWALNDARLRYITKLWSYYPVDRTRFSRSVLLRTRQAVARHARFRFAVLRFNTAWSPKVAGARRCWLLSGSSKYEHAGRPAAVRPAEVLAGRGCLRVVGSRTSSRPITTAVSRVVGATFVFLQADTQGVFYLFARVVEACRVDSSPSHGREFIGQS